jgi:hypothetical protein
LGVLSCYFYIGSDGDVCLGLYYKSFEYGQNSPFSGIPIVSPHRLDVRLPLHAPHTIASQLRQLVHLAKGVLSISSFMEQAQRSLYECP